MLPPADAYAADRARRRREASPLGSFAASLGFPLDDFQLEACEALQEGNGVLVAAPTGAGKTVVGEFAVHLALAEGAKAFYTTPIKALSNQKYHDLVRRHGAENVGLLTGDSHVNGNAPVVVMTTEVLRNMLYAGSDTLDGLAYVIMDEVHYLADRFRGPVWEEVIIHLPRHVRVAALSATVSNAEEFGAWLQQVRGSTTVVVSEHRPVPLWQHMMVGQDIYDLFVEDSSGRPTARVNPDLRDAIRGARDRDDRSWRRLDDGAPRGRRGKVRPAASSGPVVRGRPQRGPSRTDVVRRLERDGLLPAIYFIFSRAGCDAAVQQLLAADVRLVPSEEGERIRRLVENRVADIDPGDLGILGYWDFVDALSRGFAAHHAGMLPLFREVVEELFTAGRVRAVFATETLALGINMPARTVVLEKLVKYNGETHADLTPAEFTQLTGRAGRRGIDVEGHAVVLYAPQVDPESVGGLASTRTYPLRSSFHPTYNMAVNLVAQVGRGDAREILESSFAQFQADRGVVGLAQQIRGNEEALAGYAKSIECDRGDFWEYARMRRKIADLEKQAARARSAARRVDIEQSLQRLRVGDVVSVPDGRRAGRGIVITPDAAARGQGPAPVLVMDSGQARRLTAYDLREPAVVVGHLALPKSFNPRNARSRQDLAATMRAKVRFDPPGKRERERAESQSEAQITELRRRLRAHPCHDCPDREAHARWAERWFRLRRETDSLVSRLQSRTNSVAKQFDRICTVLTRLGYLTPEGDVVTADGERLRRLYTEKDLVAAECLRQGAWDRLDAAGLAAVVSTLVFEPRKDGPLDARFPGEDAREAYEATVDIWAALVEQEQGAGLDGTDEPQPGLIWSVHRWASGASLETTLRGSDVTAGDFVRACKQVIDLLGQVQVAAGTKPVAATARRAAQALLRGVVAADRLD